MSIGARVWRNAECETADGIRQLVRTAAIYGLVGYMCNKNRNENHELSQYGASILRGGFRTPAAIAALDMRKTWAFVRAVCVVLLLGLIKTENVHAFGMTEAERSLLPPYCRNHRWVGSKSVNPEGEREWMNILGPDYYHMQHYCWAIVSVSRSYRPGLPERVRKHHLELAVADIHFSTDKASPGFVLLPEIYTKLGEAYLGLHDDRNAEIAFRAAWEAKPSYWPPYVWWSQRLLKQGKVRDALLIAEEGKKNAPDAKAIDKLIDDIKMAGKASRE